MSDCLAGLIVAAGVGEDAIWMELLVILILAAGFGVYSIARKRRVKLGTRKGYFRMQRPRYGGFERLKDAAKTAAQKWTGAFSGAAKHTAVATELQTGLGTKEPAADEGKRFGTGKKRDTSRGMEILGAEFLVGVVEGLEGDDRRDVDMRSFSFNELVRRGELRAVESDALAVYAKDEHHLYSKHIQCEALGELAKRTGGYLPDEGGQAHPSLRYGGQGTDFAHTERQSSHTGVGGRAAPH